MKFLTLAVLALSLSTAFAQSPSPSNTEAYKKALKQVQENREKREQAEVEAILKANNAVPLVPKKKSVVVDEYAGQKGEDEEPLGCAQVLEVDAEKIEYNGVVYKRDASISNSRLVDIVKKQEAGKKPAGSAAKKAQGQ